MRKNGLLLSENTYNEDGTLRRVTYGNSTQQSPQEAVYRYYKRMLG